MFCNIEIMYLKFIWNLLHVRWLQKQCTQIIVNTIEILLKKYLYLRHRFCKNVINHCNCLTSLDFFFVKYVIVAESKLVLWDRSYVVWRRSHLSKNLVQPLKRSVKMNFDPARSRGYVLAMIFGTPAFDKGHSINKTIGYQYNARYKLQFGKEASNDHLYFILCITW